MFISHAMPSCQLFQKMGMRLMHMATDHVVLMSSRVITFVM